MRWAIGGGGSDGTDEDEREKCEVVGGYFMLCSLESTCSGVDGEGTNYQHRLHAQPSHSVPCATLACRSL